MSSENNVPLNLYGIMDNELQRMHALMHIFIKEPPQVAVDPSYSSYNGAGGSYHSNTQSLSEVYKRIVVMQDLLLQSVISHDKELQERIAELALTGVKNET